MKKERVVISFIILLICSISSFSQPQADPALANAYFALGDSLSISGRYDSSIVYFEKAANLYRNLQSWEKYISSLNKVSKNYCLFGNYDQAEEFAARVKNSCLEYLGSGHLEMANYFDNLGNIFYNRRQFQAALDMYKRALKIRKENDEAVSTMKADSYTGIGLAFSRIGYYEGKVFMYDSALNYYKAALEIRRKELGEIHPSTIRSLLNIANYYFFTQNFDEALILYRRVLKLRKQILPPDHPGIAVIHFNIGLLLNEKGDFVLALQSFHKALEIQQSVLHENNYSITKTYSSMGRAHFGLYNYEQALDYFNRTFRLREDILGPDHYSSSNLHLDIGSVYEYKGDYQTALNHYNKYLNFSISQLGNLNPQTAGAYNYIGNIYKRLEDFETALVFYQKSLEIRNKLFGYPHSVLGESHGNIGWAHGHLGNFNLAVEHLKKSISIRKNVWGDHHPWTATSYYFLGQVYSWNGFYREALESYQNALMVNSFDFTDSNIYSNPSSENCLSKSQLLKSLNYKTETLLLLFEKEGNIKDLSFSLKTIQVADTVIDKIRQSHQRAGDRMEVGKVTAEVYINAVKACQLLTKVTSDQYYDSLAFYFSEKNKAAVLQYNLTDNWAKKFTNLPDSLLQLEQTLKVDQSYYRSKMIEISSRENDYDSAKYALHQNKLFETNYRLDSLTLWLEGNYPRYYDIKYRNNILSVEDVQNKLDNGQLVLSYVEGDSTFYAFAITKTNFQVYHIKKDEKLKLHIKQYRNSLNPDLISSDPAKAFESFTSSSNHLYKSFVTPAFDHLTDDIDHLIIIPDGDLANMPWDTFTTAQSSVNDGPDYASLDYLLNDYSVSYGHSVSLLFQDFYARPDDAENSVLAFAPTYLMDQEEVAYENLSSEFRDELVPLNWNLFELEEIRKYFSGNFLTGSSATEKVFKKEAGNYRILHLAMHALVDHENPMRSSLVFTHVPDSLEDAMLQTHELFNMELSADMVVLSACNTGIGKMQKGEGIMSLGRGFSYAGCPSVVMSHWSVDDRSTSELMGAFYRYIAQGLSKDKALRQAKLDFLSSAHGQQTHPYYWGSFVVTGNAGPLLDSKNNQWLYLIVLSLVTGCIIFFFRYRGFPSFKPSVQ